MIKEIIASVLLALIVAAGIINMNFAIKTTDKLIEHVNTAEKQHQDGDEKAAEATLVKSLEEWVSHDQYTHIMLRHDDVDNVTEAYYELIAGLQSDSCSPALFSSLVERLTRLSEIEKPNMSSIF